MNQTDSTDIDGSYLSAMNSNGDNSQDVLDDAPQLGPRPIYDPASMAYDMSGTRLMYIFNHDTYQNTGHFPYGPPNSRDSSKHDVASLHETFDNLKFKVETCNNYTHNEIIDKLDKIGSIDHTRTSCVAITILTHGDKGGLVCAADKKYPLSDVINYLLHMPQLAGKPKLFFIQACRGGNTDPGHRIQFDGRVTVTIPTHSDSLVLMATYDDYVSYRSKKGSWMIQTLCQVLNEHHVDQDILQMMTILNHKVSSKISFSKTVPEDNEKKQVPEVRFTLTKFLKL